MLEQVTEIICEVLNLDTDDIEIKLETRFREDLEMDSLSAVELSMAVEDEFDIEVSDDSAENFVTVSDLIDYILSQK